MVDFRLTDEQQAIQKLAHEFAVKEIVPVAAEYDQTAKFPWPIVEKAYDVGLMNLNIPEEYGGAGLGLLEECLVAEELSWGCAGINGAIGLNALAALPLLIAGDETQKKTYLSRLARERQMAAYAVTEPAVGSDVANLQTTAVRYGDEYVITGTKNFITNASVANFYIVFARTDKTSRHQGISAFIVEREWAGVMPGRKDDKMGQRASDTAQLILEEVRVPKANRLGQEGDGFKIAMQVFDKSRPGVAANAVGCARRAMELALAYATERQAFGVPIIQHEGISFKIAQMAMEIAAARHLTWHAAWLIDQGLPATLEASYAKCFAADMVMRVTTEAVQVFGGYGYIKEYPVEKLMRDAKVFQIYEGTSEIQRVIIARELVKRR
ncbi:MAG: acyl-CoA dehydrogenase family protein [Acidobacteriota bacterium]|nr:acyl-CoA dehydrogenase family protein [Blastocatellia bacterium]MDW8241392.1 acyl-CoA dehydrogenase family protein [Acidobacteriota bacterium]